MSTTPQPLVAGNWKMHLLADQAARLCASLRDALPVPGVEVVVFPSFPLLPSVAAALAGSAVAWGGQDLHAADAGAHTGDVSGAQLADAGCRWVLCGHSERRRDHGESDEAVAAKVAASVRAGLAPIVCLGERREERREGRTFEVLDRQLAAVLPHLPDDLLLAYEPVWAIGTGDTATPEVAQGAHRFLRRALRAARGEAAAARARILYGGSVSPDNASALFAATDVDGFLVGGASLDAARFLAIIHACGGAPA